MKVPENDSEKSPAPLNSERSLSGSVCIELIPNKPLVHSNAIPQSQWVHVWKYLRNNSLSMLGLFGLLGLIILSLSAPLITPINPTDMDFNCILCAPQGQHYFGTDDLGRDIFSRVIWGGRESLRVGILAVAIAVGGGTVIGLISGFFGGVFDLIAQRILEVVMAIPSILLILSILAVFGAGLGTALVALGIVSIPWFARIARGAALSTKSMEYVLAAKALGGSSQWIMLFHILPGIAAP